MRVKQKQFLFLLLFTSALTFTLLSCSSPTDPSLLPTVTLTVDGVTSTEAFVKLSTNNVFLPASVSLSRNNKQINSFTLITADITIVDLALNPNQSYTYSAELTDANNQKAVSTSAIAQTMDTTSHNFTFETFTFGGQGGSSTLYDVAIINENDIWAVGEMYVYDSTGSPILYNAVHWDGQKWELKRIKTEFRGNIITIELEGIYAFSPTDIWMVGSLPIHGDGQNWTMFDVRTTTDPNLSLSKAWGVNTNDMYFVGRGGSIAHYNGSSWQKIESGTNNNITDIWGNNIDAGKIIYCVTHDQYGTNNSEIISIKNNEVTITPFNEDEIALSIWTPNKNIIYVGGGDGLFRHTNNNWEKINYNNSGYVGKIRGNANNDFFISGGFGLAAHFNGSGWRVYNEISLSTGNYSSVSMKGNIAAFVGNNYGRAVITLGRRN